MPRTSPTTRVGVVLVLGLAAAGPAGCASEEYAHYEGGGGACSTRLSKVGKDVVEGVFGVGLVAGYLALYVWLSSFSRSCH